MDEDLATAVRKALDLNRVSVEAVSQRWSWERAWEIFKENLVDAR